MLKQLKNTAELSEEEKSLLARVGYQGEESRAGTCVLVDQSVRCASVGDPGVEIMPLREALIQYDWVQDLMFGLVDPGESDHIKQAAEDVHDPVGHFVRVKAGAKVRLPVQTFSLIETPQGRQFLHNITVIEEDAEVDLISGAAVPSGVHSGHHISIEECYLREGAVCRSVSIEEWGADMQVHSYARTDLARGAHSISNQILMTPLKHHFSQSRATLAEDAVCNDRTVIFAPAGSNRTMESETLLKGKGARSESLTRMVTAGGNVVNRALIVGEAPGTKGYLGCDGLKLTDEGEILSMPGVLAKTADAQLSHEASVGMISEEKMAYLMSTGMDEDAARDLIVQGFLNLKEQELPPTVRMALEKMIAAARSGSM
ncbi:SufD family Fe-S cluster assembly protein [Afifella pfennigii]|uniref:SufD family Fe-S cluster assembly protein n=1 Tax=Afifella pfennigii TaxID=209897 RepID=UPI00047DB7A5|nr:SufD family Fe-S cluster assembly protein [Afifella pfennigii]